MPTSELSAAPAVVFKALELKPKSILDVGVGFGKYGVLLREYGEVAQGRYAPKDWKILLEGVEVFKKYSNPLWTVYNKVYNQDIRKFSFKRKYDVILLCDVLEHVSKKEAFRLVNTCLKRGKRVIITTPRGFTKQGAWFGNRNETHRCGFQPAEFKRYGAEYAASFGKVFMVTIDAKRKRKK